MARWEDRKEFTERFHAMMPQLARDLTEADGVPWMGYGNRDRDTGELWDTATLRTADGEEIWLRLDVREERVSMSGHYGELPDGSQWTPMYNARIDVPSPTVAFNRGTRAIASEIKRRLLPQYRVAMLAYRERVAAQTAYNDRQAELRADIINASHGLLRERGEEWRRNGRDAINTIDLYNIKGLQGHITVSGSDSTPVRIEAYMSRSLALRFVAMLEKGERDHE